jgi:ABC-type uncharacterized transport system substrate-binding protein
LIGYSASVVELFRRAAAFVDKILRGTKPADIPVERPTKFELVINLRTAKALGLAIPRDPPNAPRHCRRGDRIEMQFAAVRESAIGTKRTFGERQSTSAFGGKADIEI